MGCVNNKLAWLVVEKKELLLPPPPPRTSSISSPRKVPRVSPAVTDEGQMSAFRHVLQGLPRIDVPLLVVGDAGSETLVPERLANLHHFGQLFPELAKLSSKRTRRGWASKHTEVCAAARFGAETRSSTINVWPQSRLHTALT